MDNTTAYGLSKQPFLQQGRVPDEKGLYEQPYILPEWLVGLWYPHQEWTPVEQPERPTPLTTDVYALAAE